MQIAKVDAAIMQKYGKDLFNETRDSVDSFEQAAQTLVRDFYRNFSNEANEAEFALVRIFRSMKYDELSPMLQQISQTQQAQLALMATAGLEAAWNSRETSKNRQLIPINHKMSPMFQGIFKELGFQIDDFNEDAAAKGQAYSSRKKWSRTVMFPPGHRVDHRNPLSSDQNRCLEDWCQGGSRVSSAVRFGQAAPATGVPPATWASR